MIYFNSDYLEGAHSAIMARLAETNMMQTIGYSEDEICTSARERIKAACQAPDADVHFLVGGTQTNTTVIASILRPWQGVLSAVSGHINCHETGAIESTGHKVITLPTDDGKITAQQIADYVEWHKNDESTEHIVQPGMVYISQPTETGMLYSKAELTAVYDICRAYGLPLFIDGARLGYGLVCDSNDVTLPELARLCDVFYIGGTKVGALFGEALIITEPSLRYRFKAHMKQKGAVLAKGWLMGLQFAVMLESGEYFEKTKRADELAMEIKKAFEAKGIPLWVESFTNQQFVILSERQKNILAQNYYFEEEGITEQGTVVRFCTSWATSQAEADTLIAGIAAL